MTRFLLLDGLRGVAALAVVTFHVLDGAGFGSAVPNAHLAVDFFFILSAFVITHAYASRVTSASELRLFRFTLIRLVRLFPLHLLGLALGVVVVCAKYFVTGSSFVPEDFFVAFIGAIFFMPTAMLLQDGVPVGFPFNPPAWSLFFEWIGSFFWFVLLVRLKLRGLCLLTAALAISYFLVFYGPNGVFGGNEYATLQYGFIRMGFPFSVGVLLYRIRSSAPKSSATWLVAFCAASLLTLLFMPCPQTVDRGAFQALIVIVAFPVLIFVASSENYRGSFQSICDRLGSISYAVYIVHFPILQLFGAIWRKNLSSDYLIIELSLFLALIIFVSSVAMSKFDVPVRDWLSSRLLKNR